MRGLYHQALSALECYNWYNFLDAYLRIYTALGDEKHGNGDIICLLEGEMTKTEKAEFAAKELALLLNYLKETGKW